MSLALLTLLFAGALALIGLSMFIIGLFKALRSPNRCRSRLSRREEKEACELILLSMPLLLIAASVIFTTL